MREDALQHALANLATLFGALALHTRNSKLALVLGEPPHLGTGGKAGVEKKASDANW